MNFLGGFLSETDNDDDMTGGDFLSEYETDFDEQFGGDSGDETSPDNSVTSVNNIEMIDLLKELIKNGVTVDSIKNLINEKIEKITDEKEKNFYEIKIKNNENDNNTNLYKILIMMLILSQKNIDDIGDNMTVNVTIEKNDENNIAFKEVNTSDTNITNKLEEILEINERESSEEESSEEESSDDDIFNLAAPEPSPEEKEKYWNEMLKKLDLYKGKDINLEPDSKLEDSDVINPIEDNVKSINNGKNIGKWFFYQLKNIHDLNEDKQNKFFAKFNEVDSESFKGYINTVFNNNNNNNNNNNEN